MPVVNEELCVGCGRCETFCPAEALRARGYLEIDTKKCTDCFGGMYHFKQNISMSDKDYLLDLTKTSWTRLCVENCPVRALSVNEEPSN